MGRSMHEKYKNINLNKYKDLMSKYHRTKSLSKGKMIVSETNGPQILRGIMNLPPRQSRF